MKKIHINVFVTKNQKFRASIQENGEKSYEVTIGGIRWNEGVGNKHKEIIIKKCENLLNTLNSELNKLKNQD